MKILIVNGYPQTQKGAEDFHRYQLIIQELFRTQKDFVDTDFEFIIRRRDNLDDFIYELDSSHVKKTSARAFDYIDMVFVEGDPNLLPWSPQASKIMILLRMCIRTKKVLFTSAFGMQALVFLAATNTEKTIHVVNGKGKGGQLTEIIQSNDQPVGMKPDEYCLDNVTGDLYSFNYETNEWTPKMNVGIHYAKAAQAFGSLGKYVVNTPVYKPRVVEGRSISYVSKVDEDICYTKKVYLQHWAISDLPSDFVVPAKNTWDIHKFNFVNANKTFLVLAESKRSPQILVFEPHCIATQFNITKKYPITVSIMHNFVTSKLREIKAMTKNHVVSVEKVSEQYRSVAENYFPFSNGVSSGPQQGERKSVSNSRIFSSTRPVGSSDRLLDEASSNRPKTAKLAHSGYALAHQDGGNLIVKNNTVRNDFNIKLLEQTPGTKGTFYQSRAVTKTGGTDSQEGDYYINSRFNGTATKGYSSTKELHNVVSGTLYQPRRDQSQNNDKMARTNSFGPNFNESNHGYIYEDNQPQSSFRTEPVFNKNRAEVGRMLYPDLSKDTLKEEEFWVPGQLSTKIRPQTATNREKVKIRMETSYSNRFFSTYNKFKNVDPDEARAKPSIRVSGDYVTDDEVKRRQEKENNKRNIGPSYVSTGGKGVKAFMIPNYVNLTYSEPAANHKYREVQKNRWVAGPMKLC